MKIIVAVAIVVCAILQIVSVRGSLDTQLVTVNEGINAVQKIVAHLRKIQYVDVFLAMSGPLEDGLKTAPQVIRSQYNETIDYLEEMNNNATAEGKDATGCAETARHDLETSQITGLTGVDECFDSVRGWMNATENLLDSKIQDGRKILSYLNSIFPSCYIADSQKIESCINQILPNATQMVETYRTAMATSLNNMGPSKPVEDQFSNCLNGIGRTLGREWSTIQSDFEKCITDL